MAPPAQLRRLLPGVFAACVGLVLAAGCGGGSSSQTSASHSNAPQEQNTTKAKFSTVDACSLVQASDATTAVGGTQMAAAPGGGGAAQQSLCIYGPQDTSSGSSAGVFVMAVVYPDQATADAINPEQVAAMFRVSGVSDAKIVNIGDKAVEYQATTQSGSGIAIFVFRANVLMMISLEPGDSTKIEALARVAVSNLDKAQSS